ncbi:hypothetical protein [Streptomyces sp. NPDC059708]|uniref:hypothetical protein n=1 Tax=Streptomyces sp. NPDC059708 TaxID=3346916 RepID=UPI0036C1EB5A
MSLTVPLGVGLVLGLIGPVTEKSHDPVSVVVNAVFSGGWSWACYAFLVGRLRRSKVESALLPALGLAIGVVTYYLLKGGSTSAILVWGTLAFVFGAPVGFLGNAARIPGVGGLGFRLLIPLVAFYETSMRLTTEARGSSAAVLATWNAVRFTAVAVALALVGQVVRSWWQARRTRSSGPEAPS